MSDTAQLERIIKPPVAPRARRFEQLSYYELKRAYSNVGTELVVWAIVTVCILFALL
ncbi:MAG: hypothetical protein ABW171_01175 [Steroidobacter sp.]